MALDREGWASAVGSGYVSFLRPRKPLTLSSGIMNSSVV